MVVYVLSKSAFVERTEKVQMLYAFCDLAQNRKIIPRQTHHETDPSAVTHFLTKLDFFVVDYYNTLTFSFSIWLCDVFWGSFYGMFNFDMGGSRMQQLWIPSSCKRSSTLLSCIDFHVIRVRMLLGSFSLGSTEHLLLIVFHD